MLPLCTWIYPLMHSFVYTYMCYMYMHVIISLIGEDDKNNNDNL